MEQTDITLTHTEAQAMRSILTPLCPIMEEATLEQTPTEDEIFFDIALPLLTHLQLSLTEIVSVASLWRQLWETIQLKCIMDGQWCQMGNYVVLTVKFGIRNT